ncbi:hypothetical protein RUM43_008831 [Polyplax serrata]|uniref:Uncharacterized protein n=1 Tax=Polyplax serrata TaxID=468196 RepID=A0AAN8PVI6_POLSC
MTGECARSWMENNGISSSGADDLTGKFRIDRGGGRRRVGQKAYLEKFFAEDSSCRLLSCESAGIHAAADPSGNQEGAATTKTTKKMST